MAGAFAMLNPNATPMGVEAGGELTLNFLVSVQGDGGQTRSLSVVVPADATPHRINKALVDAVIAYASSVSITVDASEVVFVPMDRG